MGLRQATLRRRYEALLLIWLCTLEQDRDLLLLHRLRASFPRLILRAGSHCQVKRGLGFCVDLLDIVKRFIGQRLVLRRHHVKIAILPRVHRRLGKLRPGSGSLLGLHEF